MTTVRKLLACLLLLAAPMGRCAEPGPDLVGDWQLVHAYPVDPEESLPRGVENLRLRVTADGQMWFVHADEALADAEPARSYRIDAGTLSLFFNSGNTGKARLEFESRDAASLTFVAGLRWHLQRLAPGAIEAPGGPRESVEYLEEHPFATAPRYEANAASGPVTTANLVGRWELVEKVIAIKQDLPPYGFTNDVLSFDGGKLVWTERYGGRSRTLPVVPYRAESGKIVLGDGTDTRTIPATFDAWGRLVLGEPAGARDVFKFVDRATTARLPPPRIILSSAGSNHASDAHPPSEPDSLALRSYVHVSSLVELASSLSEECALVPGADRERVDAIHQAWTMRNRRYLDLLPQLHTLVEAAIERRATALGKSADWKNGWREELKSDIQMNAIQSLLAIHESSDPKEKLAQCTAALASLADGQSDVANTQLQLVPYLDGMLAGPDRERPGKR